MSAPAARRTGSAEETERLGESLAPSLREGDVLALSGPLGSGKTCLVAGLARGLECKARVRSPTYALVNEYHGRILLVHLDLYRLEPAEAMALGIEEYGERAALAVEWAEKLPQAWRAEALKLTLSLGERPEERSIAAEAEGGRGIELLEAWNQLPMEGRRSGSPA